MFFYIFCGGQRRELRKKNNKPAGSDLPAAGAQAAPLPEKEEKKGLSEVC